MTRAYALLVWFFVGFCGMFGAGFAFAEGTVPKSGGQTAAVNTPITNHPAAKYRSVEFGNAYASASQSNACTSGYTPVMYNGVRMCQNNSNNNIRHDLLAFARWDEYGCGGTPNICWTANLPAAMSQTFSSSAFWHCPDSETPVAQGTMCGVAPTCPANSTDNGASCTCNSGFKAEGGVCVAIVCDPAAADSTASGNVYNDPANSGAATNGCFNGCLMTPSSTTTTSDGKVWTRFKPASGATCAEGPAAAPAAPTEAECMHKGGGYVTVGGVTTCAPPVATSETKETTTTPGGGSPPVTSSEKKVTACEGGECTQTKTGPDGTATTTTQTQGAFCEENPNSPFCKGLKDTCVETPNRIGCAEFGEVGDPGELTSQPRGASSIVPVSVASSFGCPADVQLPKGLVFSYSGACEFAEGVRPVVLAMAWLIAGLIAFGFKSE